MESKLNIDIGIYWSTANHRVVFKMAITKLQTPLVFKSLTIPRYIHLLIDIYIYIYIQLGHEHIHIQYIFWRSSLYIRTQQKRELTKTIIYKSKC